MKYSNIIKIAALIISLSGCISQSQLQTAQDNSKRLEMLIDKERKDNDELNSRRSVLESQIANLNTQNSKIQNEKTVAIESLNNDIAKLKADNKKLQDQLKSQDASIQQQKANDERTIEALGEKINDLAEDKKELITEKYNARKQSSSKRRRRR
jgi:chromosome segregation ATPase